MNLFYRLYLKIVELKTFYRSKKILKDSPHFSQAYDISFPEYDFSSRGQEFEDWENKLGISRTIK